MTTRIIKTANGYKSVHCSEVKKGDLMLTVSRTGKQKFTKLLHTPLFNAEGMLTGWSSD